MIVKRKNISNGENLRCCKKQKLKHGVAKRKNMYIYNLQASKKRKMEVVVHTTATVDNFYVCLIHTHKYICDIYECNGVKKIVKKQFFIDRLSSYIA
jgi:hypothetical protein